MEKYLAFDASGEELVVCGFNGSEFCMKQEHGTGTEKIMAAIDGVLKDLRMEIVDVAVVGVCVGPGSWTGCRVAICTALGLVCGLKKEVKVVSFNSFDLISYNRLGKDAVVVVKAYANFVYAKSEKYGMECITKEEFLNKFEGKSVISNLSIFGNEEIVCENKMREVVEDKISKAEYLAVDDVEPLYLRKSQAELQREGKNGK